MTETSLIYLKVKVKKKLIDCFIYESYFSLLKEKQDEVELLTNALKEKETLACQLQTENDDLNKGLRHGQEEIEELLR